jgi:hypothetical protein
MKLTHESLNIAAARVLAHQFDCLALLWRVGTTLRKKISTQGKSTRKTTIEKRFILVVVVLFIDAVGKIKVCFNELHF